MQSGEEETVQYTMRMIKERKANERARENDVEGAEKSRSSWFVLALATTYVPWHNGGSATAAAQRRQPNGGSAVVSCYTQHNELHTKEDNSIYLLQVQIQLACT